MKGTSSLRIVSGFVIQLEVFSAEMARNLLYLGNVISVEASQKRQDRDHPLNGGSWFCV